MGDLISPSFQASSFPVCLSVLFPWPTLNRTAFGMLYIYIYIERERYTYIYIYSNYTVPAEREAAAAKLRGKPLV